MSATRMLATILLAEILEALGKDGPSAGAELQYLQTAGPALTAYLNAVAGLIEGAPYPQCRGIRDSRCNYLSTCGGICNKCGRVHDNGQSQPAAAADFTS